MTFIVYTIDNCEHCDKLLNKMRENGYAYEEVNVSKNPIANEWLIQREYPIPVVFVNGKVVEVFKEN